MSREFTQDWKRARAYADRYALKHKMRMVDIRRKYDMKLQMQLRELAKEEDAGKRQLAADGIFQSVEAAFGEMSEQAVEYANRMDTQRDLVRQYAEWMDGE